MDISDSPIHPLGVSIKVPGLGKLSERGQLMPSVGQSPPRRGRGEGNEAFLSFSAYSTLHGAIYFLMTDIRGRLVSRTGLSCQHDGDMLR